MSPYRIVLADDHISLRQEIKKIIEVSDDMQVVGEAGDGIDLLSLLKTETADMIILDISMPNLKSIDPSRDIKIIQPEIDILILILIEKKEYLIKHFPPLPMVFCSKEISLPNFLPPSKRCAKAVSTCHPCFQERCLLI